MISLSEDGPSRFPGGAFPCLPQVHSVPAALIRSNGETGTTGGGAGGAGTTGGGSGAGVSERSLNIWATIRDTGPIGSAQSAASRGSGLTMQTPRRAISAVISKPRSTMADQATKVRFVAMEKPPQWGAVGFSRSVSAEAVRCSRGSRTVHPRGSEA